MSKLHSQLALFGAIDREVIDAKNRLRASEDEERAPIDDAVIGMVEKFLPGSTGFGQHGWYAELTTYLKRAEVPPGGERVDFPDLRDALEDLAGDVQDEDDRDPVLARAAYAAVVLEKIYGVTGRPPRDDEDNVLKILPRAVGAWVGQQGGNPADPLIDKIDSITNRQNWVEQVQDAVSKEFAVRSRPCFGALKKVGGQYCAFITTDTEDAELKVGDIAKIVEPLNWDICCQFFCEMTEQRKKFNDDGWSRIVERISGECQEYYLDTALIFWKQELQDHSIFINYDLDPCRENDTGLVEVDSGYIWITPLPNQPTGVRIRTSKLERVSGLSPTATAALACLLGWGSTGHEMLAGTARKHIKDPDKPPPKKPFAASPFDQSPYKG